MLNKGFIGGIKPFRFVTHAVLPLVYDDSLSYYEVLSKVVAKLNELIVADNNLAESTKEIVTEWISDSEEGRQAIEDAINDYVEEYSETPAFILTINQAIQRLENLDEIITTALELWLVSSEGVTILDGAVDDYLDAYVKTDAFKQSVEDAIATLTSVTRGETLRIYQKQIFNAVSKISAISSSVLDDDFVGQIVSQIRAEAIDANSGKIVMQAKSGASTKEVILDNAGLHVPDGVADDNPMTMRQFNNAVIEGKVGTFMIMATGTTTVAGGNDEFMTALTLNKSASDINSAITERKLPIINVGNTMSFISEDEFYQMYIFNRIYFDEGTECFEFINPNNNAINIRKKLVVKVVDADTNVARIMFDTPIAFNCKFTITDDEDNPIICDRTNSEIVSAFVAGREINAVIAIDDVTTEKLYVNTNNVTAQSSELTLYSLPIANNGVTSIVKVYISNLNENPIFTQMWSYGTVVIDVTGTDAEHVTHIGASFEDTLDMITNGVNVIFDVTLDDFEGVTIRYNVKNYHANYIIAYSNALMTETVLTYNADGSITIA